MKPESLNALRRMHDFCEGIIAEPETNPKVVALALTEMQVLLNQVRRNEAAADPDLGVTSEEVDLMKAGKVIWAIKEVRNRTGLGLKEAKDLVEQAGDKLGLRVADTNAWGGYRWTMPFK